MKVVYEEPEVIKVGIPSMILDLYNVALKNKFHEQAKK